MGWHLQREKGGMILVGLILGSFFAFSACTAVTPYEAPHLVCEATQICEGSSCQPSNMTFEVVIEPDSETPPRLVLDNRVLVLMRTDFRPDPANSRSELDMVGTSTDDDIIVRTVIDSNPIQEATIVFDANTRPRTVTGACELIWKTFP